MSDDYKKAAQQYSTSELQKKLQSKGQPSNQNHNNSSGDSSVDIPNLSYGQIGAAALIILGGYLSTRYKVAKSNEYLVKTGLFIKDITVDKKTFHLPYQTIAVLDLAPRSYNFTIHAMSKEKMEFFLPAVFTIAPKDEMDHLKTFAKYLLYESVDNISDIVKGMIEGETRVLAANLSIEDIFKGRNEFKLHIVQNVQAELDKLGLTIINANIKELQDSPNSRYFSFLAQKVSADAENQAKIDIAEAKKVGNIGEKEREGSTRQRVVEIESQTTVFENERKREIEQSNAILSQRKSEYNQSVQIAKIESDLNAKRREEELQKEVELKRLEREVERRRAEELSKARVEAEIKKTDAAGQAAAMQQIADAELYKAMKEGDSQLYNKLKEAEGIQAIYSAQAEGLQRIISAFGGDYRAMLNYLMIEKDLYPKLAEQSAKAIQGLNPKITIWNTGGDGNNNTYDNISKVAKSIPPILQTIEEQTGITLPDWLLKTKTPEELKKMTEDHAKVKELLKANESGNSKINSTKSF